MADYSISHNALAMFGILYMGKEIYDLGPVWSGPLPELTPKPAITHITRKTYIQTK